MNRDPLKPNLTELESLFASERELVPESECVRERVLERARAAVPRNLWLRPARHAPRLRRLRLREAAAAAVLLSAVCAAAFYGGYQVRNKQSVASAAAPALELSSAVRPIPSVAASVSSPTASAPAASIGVSQAVRLAAKPRAAEPTKAATETEAFAAELRVLQPARQAVARQDYAAALSSIAEHRRRYASGKLVEEREALRVKALLGLGRTAEALRAGTAFRARFPHSVLLGRIDEMLGISK